MTEENKSTGLRGMLLRLSAYYRNANAALKASLWFAFCSFVQKGISVLTMPIFTRLMSTEQYGQYNVFLSWYNILVILVSLNIHSEIFNKGLIEHAEEQDAYTASQAGLLIALSAFWIALYLPLRNFFNAFLGLTTVLVLFMFFEILGSSLVGLWTARKRFSFEYQKIVRLTLSMAILNPLVGMAAVLLTEHKAEARIISNAVIPIAAALGLLIVIARKGSLFQNRVWWKPALLAALPLIPHYLSLVLLNQSDKLMIDHFSGAADAAIYSVAHSAGLLLTIVNTSINHSFVPWSYDKLKNHQGAGIRRISSMLLLLVALINVLLIWLAPEAVHLLAAPQYGEAIWCLVPIAMSVFFFFAYTLFVDVEIYYGGNRYIAVASVLAAALNVALNAVFIPGFGYVAAGYTTLFSYAATMLLHLLFLKLLLKERGAVSRLFDLRMLAAVSLLLAALSAVGMLLYGHPILRLGIVAAACAAAVFRRRALIHIFSELKNRGAES